MLALNVYKHDLKFLEQNALELFIDVLKHF